MTTARPVRTALVPWAAEYDLLGGRVEFRPYVLALPERGVSLPSVRIDELGLRFSLDACGEPWAVANGPRTDGHPIGVLVGNSVAFGVGTTSDGAHLASRLAAHSGRAWASMTARTFTAWQELILFQTHRHLLGPIDEIVVFSGLNDLYLYFLPTMDDPVFGVCFYLERLRRALTPSLALSDQPTRVLIKELLLRLRHRRPQTSVTLPDIDASVRARRPQRAEILERLDRVLGYWAMISRQEGVALRFVLQPLLPWLDRPMEPQEVALLDEADAQADRWNTLMRAVLDLEMRNWYVDGLAQICRRHGLAFTDFNATLAAAARPGEWLFVDRVHLTDLGHDRCAALLAANG